MDVEAGIIMAQRSPKAEKDGRWPRSRICYRRLGVSSLFLTKYGDKMKKIIILMTSLILLTSCVKVSLDKMRRRPANQPVVKNLSPFVRGWSVQIRTMKSWKLAENLSKTIQRLELQGDYLHFYQDTFGTVSPCSIWVNHATTTIDRDVSFVSERVWWGTPSWKCDGWLSNQWIGCF